MPPTLKKLTGHIGFGLCVRPSVHACMRPSIRLRTVHARVLNFIYGFLMEKIFDTHFFSCTSYLPFLSNAPLKKSDRNLMHAISYEPCMLGF